MRRQDIFIYCNIQLGVNGWLPGQRKDCELGNENATNASHTTSANQHSSLTPFSCLNPTPCMTLFSNLGLWHVSLEHYMPVIHISQWVKIASKNSNE